MMIILMMIISGVRNITMNGNEKRDVIRVGSRKSRLAVRQTDHVIQCLQEIHPELKFEIIKMSTKGDKILDKCLPKIGEKSLFTKELESALENDNVDFVVHSLKDLSTTLPDEMALGAILKREDPRDAVVMSKKFKDKTLASLPKDSIIGTSSLRRSAQLSRNMPHLKIESIRGNLDTRLKKLDDENSPYAAIILAAAGLKRMNEENRISQLLEPEEALYAIGQGALGVECRKEDWKICTILEPLFDLETTLTCVCERSFLETLNGGCSAPIGVSSSLKKNELTITGAVWSLDGQTLITDTSKSKLWLPNDDGEPLRKCPYQEPRRYCGVFPNNKLSSISLFDAELLGKDLAKSLIKKNALDVMSQARDEILKDLK